MSLDGRNVVVVGGGHNGLVCAFYLARAGFKVSVFERRGVVGGAAVTEEFHPGFRNSVASYTVSLLAPRIIEDMRLAAYGLRILERPISNFLALDDANYLKVGGWPGAYPGRGCQVLRSRRGASAGVLPDARWHR